VLPEITDPAQRDDLVAGCADQQINLLEASTNDATTRGKTTELARKFFVAKVKGDSSEINNLAASMLAGRNPFDLLVLAKDSYDQTGLPGAYDRLYQAAVSGVGWAREKLLAELMARPIVEGTTLKAAVPIGGEREQTFTLSREQWKPGPVILMERDGKTPSQWFHLPENLPTMPAIPIVFSKGLALEGISAKPIPDGLLKAEADGKLCTVAIKPTTGEAVITPPSATSKTFELKLSAAGWITQSIPVGDTKGGQAYLADGAYRVPEPRTLKRERAPLPVRLPPQKLVDYDFLDVEWIGPLKDQPGAVFVLNEQPVPRSAEGPKKVRLAINGDENSIRGSVGTGRYKLMLRSKRPEVIKEYAFREEIELRGETSPPTVELPGSIAGTYAGLLKHDFIAGGDVPQASANLDIGTLQIGPKLATAGMNITSYPAHEFAKRLQEDSYTLGKMVIPEFSYLLGASSFVLEDPWTVSFTGLWNLVEHQFIFQRKLGVEMRMLFTMPEIRADQGDEVAQFAAVYDRAWGESEKALTRLSQNSDLEVRRSGKSLYQNYQSALRPHGNREADIKNYASIYREQFDHHRRLCETVARYSTLKRPNFAYGTFFSADRKVSLVFEDEDWKIIEK
jgi:hypothetical protein